MKQLENYGNEIDLMKYRIEKARSDVKAANVLMGIDDYMGANNRSYYAIFHAISAVHALEGQSYRKHKDTIAIFNKEYVKTEVFPRKIGRRIARAEEIRHASDYDDFYIASKEKSEEQIKTAEELIELVEDYCKRRMESEGQD